MNHNKARAKGPFLRGNGHLTHVCTNEEQDRRIRALAQRRAAPGYSETRLFERYGDQVRPAGVVVA